MKMKSVDSVGQRTTRALEYSQIEDKAKEKLAKEKHLLGEDEKPRLGGYYDPSLKSDFCIQLEDTLVIQDNQLSHSASK